MNKFMKALYPKLRECDFSEVANGLVCHFSRYGALSVIFLAENTRSVFSRGVNPTDGKPVKSTIRSVLAYYSLSKGVVNLHFHMCRFSNLAAQE